MSSISFDYGPFVAYISSHGHYGIAARDIPWAAAGPLPGLLEHGRAETLNETWNSEGRKPERLIGTDDDMPDIADPRVEMCLRLYVEKHMPSLQQRYKEARRRWSEMQQQTFVVKRVPLRPGQRVRLYFTGPPAVNGQEFVFHAIDDKGCIYLGGGNGFRAHGLGASDYLEPVDPK
jgi:hypothetical protein